MRVISGNRTKSTIFALGAKEIVFSFGPKWTIKIVVYLKDRSVFHFWDQSKIYDAVFLFFGGGTLVSWVSHDMTL